MKLYFACLASYNSGILHGAWIDADSDTDAMQAKIDAMLRASPCPNVEVFCSDCFGVGEGFPGCKCQTCKGTGVVLSAEEWAVHDYDDFPNMGEYPDLEDVAAYVGLVGEFSWHDEDELRAVVDYADGDVESARDMLNDNYCGTYMRFEDYAEEYADEHLLHDAPEALSRDFDYEAFARDLSFDMNQIETPKGVMVFHAA